MFKLRLPIGSYGDGMRRLLAISLALVGTKDRCLLIDEIDIGLHWTVMEDMWRACGGRPRNVYDVQVFATTHSYDCIKGSRRTDEISTGPVGVRGNSKGASITGAGCLYPW